MKHLLALGVYLFVLLWPSAAPAQARSAGNVTVVSAGPTDEIAGLAEAREIRIVFSEPMVELGRIPAVVRPPYVTITPAIPGAFRWSGTTILIFTPDAKTPLPFATRYDVTVDGTAAAISGRTLGIPYTFTFTTPTVKLLRTEAYRRGGRADAPFVVLMRFNQAVNPGAVAAQLSARFTPHKWATPVLSADSQKRLAAIDGSSLARFQAKVAATNTAASSNAPVTLRLTNDWDKKRYPPARTLVAFETVTAVPSESFVTLTIAGGVKSTGGSATPGKVQEYQLEAEPAFFVTGFDCSARCDPDDRNPLGLRTPVKVADFARAMRVANLADGGKDVPRPAPSSEKTANTDVSPSLTLEDAGYTAQPPATSYVYTLDGGLKSVDGQTLGYTWVGTVENWHRTAFTSFGDGHGVWESGGGTVLPFYARNLFTVKQWAAPLTIDTLMPAITALAPAFAKTPPSDPASRKLGLTNDRIQSHGLDVAKALGPRGTGIVWTAVENGESVKDARRSVQPVRASLVQVTNLGISVKDSPQNTLIFVTRLDNAAPVAGARVSIVHKDNSLQWTGTTGPDGTAVGPGIPVNSVSSEEDCCNYYEQSQRPNFVVFAEKDGDVAYVGNNWNEGIEPWSFNVSFDREQAEPMLRGTVFSDRGVYRLGEEIHFKTILRHNTPAGIRLLRTGTPVSITLRDSQYRVVEQRTVTVNEWSSAEWETTLPADGALGNYSVRAVLESERPKVRAPEDLKPGEEPGPEADDYVSYQKSVNGSFLVAAYRRPDFRVDVSLKGARAMAGDPLKGVVTARYLFGAAMGTRPVKWQLSRSPVYSAPPAVEDKFPSERWQFVGWPDRDTNPHGVVGGDEATLTKAGELPLTLTPQVDAGVPYMYTLEGDVEDVSRQHIANRASLLVHPASWYIGVRRPAYFLQQKSGLATEIVAVSPDGQAVAGVPVTVTLTQIQWNSVRRTEGNGFYTWDTERKEIPIGSWNVTTTAEPVPLQVALPNGGYFMLVATAHDTNKRFTVTRSSFYALGDGYTAWERFDHNRIELVPERKTYKPGDTARIMIQSPWERATALVTTEREGVRSHRQFTLTSTQESISIPITEDDIPNLFVSVLLVKGRSQTDVKAGEPKAEDRRYDSQGPNVVEDPSDSGKPAFRLGYVELEVEDASKRLTVDVRADKEEYRPANAAKVQVTTKDANGRGAPSEVTLWAVDYGVLSLTAYRTPDVVRSVYVRKALQVMNSDNRQRIISRRVLTPKGETEGGGGGADAGAGTLRKDFRVLAFWLGSVATDEYGKGAIDVKLPESLTTYRIMAVAADRASRFGANDTEVRVNKPLTLKPTFPRFLAVGDTAHFGAVVTSQLKAAGQATVTIASLDPDVLEFTGGAEQTLALAAGGSIEARFDASSKRVGQARIRMTVKMGEETDAFEDVIPVEVLTPAETVAAYGEVADAKPAAQALRVPASVVPGMGGLRVELASTAMVGLGEGARYLVEYPYGCAEQRGSRTLALVLAADLGDAFTLPGMNTKMMRPSAQDNLKQLEKFQCSNGGFAYWPGDCAHTSPYLTAYLLHVFKAAADLKYQVDAGMRSRAYRYLEQSLAENPPAANEGWWPSYTAWQAFAVKVLVEGGRNQDSHLTRLYGYRDRMPVFGLAYLHDAYRARGTGGPDSSSQIADLRRRMANAILTEAGSSHVEELSDPYLLYFWNSNMRTTSIVLNSLVKADVADAPVRQLVRWMMAARKDGRWGNTQENALAMEALVAYYRKFEGVVPDFRAVVRLGSEDLVNESFTGRTTTSKTKEVPLGQILARNAAGTSQPLTFAREGSGTLFYASRLRYVPEETFLDGLDNGIRVTRSYAPYVENATRPAATTYKAGDLIRVTLSFELTKERRFVAVTDPLPAGLEPVESWFATTAASLARNQDNQGEESHNWYSWWQRGGFDHVERFDDRVNLFATRLSEGHHEFSYIVRATTAGTFRTAPARAEEMYTPEVFGRTPTMVIEVRR